MTDSPKPELVFVPGSMKTVNSRPVGLRWLGDKLQFSCEWQDGPIGGIEWHDVPVVPVESAAKCDGNHGGPPCADPGCWNDDPLYASWGVYMHLRADLQGAMELARAHRTEAGTEAWVQFITSRLLHLATVRGKLAGDAARAPTPDWVPPGESWRWNIQRDGDALLVCFNQHDKGQPCEVVRYVPECAPSVREVQAPSSAVSVTRRVQVALWGAGLDREVADRLGEVIVAMVRAAGMGEVGRG